MAKFEQQIFTVGANSGQAHKNYVNNYDAAMGKKKRKTKPRKKEVKNNESDE